MVLVAVEHARRPAVGVEREERGQARAPRTHGHHQREHTRHEEPADVDRGGGKGQQVEHREVGDIESPDAIPSAVRDEIDPAVEREQDQRRAEQEEGPHRIEPAEEVRFDRVATGEVGARSLHRGTVGRARGGILARARGAILLLAASLLAHVDSLTLMGARPSLRPVPRPPNARAR